MKNFNSHSYKNSRKKSQCVVFWHYQNWNSTWSESHASQNTQNLTQSKSGISCKFAADIFKCNLHLFHCNYRHTGKSTLKLHLCSAKLKVDQFTYKCADAWNLATVSACNKSSPHSHEKKKISRLNLLQKTNRPDSYVYWTAHHLTSWINWTNLMSLYESFFIAQHVSNVITFILRSWRLYVGVLFCFGVYWCIGAVRLE